MINVLINQVVIGNSASTSSNPNSGPNKPSYPLSRVKRLQIGLKKGWDTNTLPDHLMKLYTNPLIRIFRVLGGMSIIALLTGKLYYLPPFVLYAVFGFAVVYALFMVYLTYHRIKHIIYILKSDKLEVRNSPLDKFATLAGKLLLCVKGACEAGAPVGLALGVMAGFDQILEHKGRAPIFLPLIADTVLPDSAEDKIYKDRKASFRDIVKIDNKYKEMLAEKDVVYNLEQSNLFSQEDINLMKEGLTKHETELLSNKDELVEKIKSSYDKGSGSGKPRK